MRQQCRQGCIVLPIHHDSTFTSTPFNRFPPLNASRTINSTRSWSAHPITASHRTENAKLLLTTSLNQRHPFHSAGATCPHLQCALILFGAVGVVLVYRVFTIIPWAVKTITDICNAQNLLATPTPVWHHASSCARTLSRQLYNRAYVISGLRCATISRFRAVYIIGCSASTARASPSKSPRPSNGWTIVSFVDGQLQGGVQWHFSGRRLETMRRTYL